MCVLVLYGVIPFNILIVTLLADESTGGGGVVEEAKCKAGEASRSLERGSDG